MADDVAQDEGLEGGSYEVIRRRLVEQGASLAACADALNERRKDAFGSTELTIIGTERVRTENNCIPVDMATVGGRLLFGYNVFIGLKKEVAVQDVFSLQQFREVEGGFEFDPADETAADYLQDPAFLRDFSELYQYYAEAQLAVLRTIDSKLLAIFKVGPTAIKVLRWALSPDGGVTYIDNRGERDHVYPPAHDFQWTVTTPKDHVRGRHPHVSIEDVVFVETVGGDLTVKVEDNTEDGEGIYREPVVDLHQSLDDGEIHYARVGTLILLKIRPAQELLWRYLVFDTLTTNVVRIDAIGNACVQLPEDHGIIFPGGYYLQTGDYKIFDDGDVAELLFKRRILAPNGEDVLFIFHRKSDGLYLLFPYNLIRKEVSTPIRCHGYSLFDDGKLLIFRATDGASRVHPIQIWLTPFSSDEFAASAPTDGSLLSRIGNADLVRGISDAYTLRRLIDSQEPTRRLYEDLVRSATRMLDAYYWLGEAELGNLRGEIEAIRRTAELVIDEFEKVVTLRARAAAALSEVGVEQGKLLSGLRAGDLYKIEQFLDAMTALRKHRGHLITLREIRYIDLAKLDVFEAQIIERFDQISRACVDFLQRDEALSPILARIGELLVEIEAVDQTHRFEPLEADLERSSTGLSLLAEVVGSLQVDDAAARTRILESISEVFAQLNRVRAILVARRKELGAAEARLEFGAQFKLLGQSVQSALSLSVTPEDCDEQLSRLMLQLEELEGRFGEFDEFLPEMIARREEVSEAFSTRRQALLDERQRRIGGILAAADRILVGLARRAQSFKAEDDLNAYFASDAMVLKLRQLSEQLGALGDNVKSDELLSRLKSARQDALRQLRDASELFEGDNLIRFGRHLFAVNTQAVELTMVPRGEGMSIHLTGTDFYEALQDEAVVSARPYWGQSVVSEDGTVYRGEFLAASILFAAQAGRDGLSQAALTEAALQDGGLLTLTRRYAADRYDEGYERGLHDADAAAILGRLLSIQRTAGLLRFPPAPRAVAALFWSGCADDVAKERWHRRARSLARLRAALRSSPALVAFARELGGAITDWLTQTGVDAALSLTWGDLLAEQAGQYLAEELAAEHPRFTVSAEAAELVKALEAWLASSGQRFALDEDLRALSDRPAERIGLAYAWMEAFCAGNGGADAPAILEAVARLLCDRGLDWQESHAMTVGEITGLLGQHPRITGRTMEIRLDEFLGRLTGYIERRVPGYLAWRATRHEVLQSQRERLRLDEFKPRVMTSFVRNKLINEVYLHLIGDNLAKQMGAAGAGKRTDLMGLLLLISPPGYGKTTLMEYVASRLGLVFMKVNGPALGHEVHSLDPAEAPNATARQEVEKINLALEMGNNVMLYLDDIQHTHSELLQKFISLCDGQRKIEGVWRGRTRTYDLRGKKFCVVMAGNPYTESGDRFQIPDMLSNRADTYNLGDVLSGKDDLFALSYIENALTSSATLAPLSARGQEDTYKLIAMAQGQPIASADLSHGYSAVEIGEITTVFQHMFKVQETLLAVNLEYIRSASMDDAFRTEPRFQLQGSYRNMNKIAEKIVPAMNADELERLIVDHYAGEAQTLTTGAEANLLKFAELRGTLTAAQAERWAAIKAEFSRQKLMGGADDDPVARITGTLSGLSEQLKGIGAGITGVAAASQADQRAQVAALSQIHAALSAQATDERLSALAGELAGVRSTLEAGTAGDLAGQVSRVSTWLGHIHKSLKADAAATQLTDIAAQLAALQTALAGTTAGMRQLRVLDWLSPRLDTVKTPADVARIRAAVLADAAGALRGEEVTTVSPQDTALAAALPVIHDLVLSLAELVRAQLPEDRQEVFMDTLRQRVAGAVTALAEED